MKKSALFIPALLFSSLLFSQACDSLFSSCVSTFSRQGYYFDLEAVNQVEVNGFSIMAQTPGSRDMAIYYRAGTYLGNEGNASAWTLLGNLSSFTPFSATACPIVTSAVNIPFSVCIPQGQRYGFYITMSAGIGTLESHNTLAEGSIGAQDANLILITGKGQMGAGIFTGTLLGGLTFQGGIQYQCTCTPTGLNAEDYSLIDLLCFPVPSSGFLNIQFPDGSPAQGELQVMDVTGKIVFIQKTGPSNGSQLSADVSFLSPGFYTILLRNGEGILGTGHFIKE